jgi:uncharacterized membrane protein YeaQ/YmgE (transglycosylase-associated protein family)
MGMLSCIFLGLVAGAFAKFIMPGKAPGGIFVTILIGIAGGMVGFFLERSSVSGKSSRSTSVESSSPQRVPSCCSQPTASSGINRGENPAFRTSSP